MLIPDTAFTFSQSGETGHVSSAQMEPWQGYLLEAQNSAQAFFQPNRTFRSRKAGAAQVVGGLLLHMTRK